MFEYIVISKEVAETYAGLVRGQDSFGYAITLDGRYVTSANALEDFADILPENPQIITLTNDDFPVPHIDYP